MNVGIRPVDRPQSTGSTDGVNRRDEGSGSSSAFSPKTNVSIKNAVDDMAGILAKISSNQAEAVDKMPEDLQKMIQNVMKQAFSLNESLGQGLGSTMESQRFSMDQLGTLSRMLSQLGNLAEKGTTAEVSDTLQALLTNLKTMVGTDSSASLEPVLLTKAAFELLDTKDVSDLPQQLQQLLASLQPQGQTATMTAGESSPMAFLKQLVQYFMPRPAADSTATTASNEQGANGSAQNGQASQQTAGNTSAAQTAVQNAPNTANAQNTQNAQNGQQSSGQNTGNGSNAQSQANQAGQSAGQNGTANQPGTAGQMQQPGTSQAQSGTTANQPAGQQTAGNTAQAESQPGGSQTKQNNLPGQLQNGQTGQSGQAAQTTQQPAAQNGQNLPQSQQPQGSQSGTAAQPGQEQTASQPGQANGQANAQSQVQENNPLLRQQSAAPTSNPQQAENMPQQSVANQAKNQLMMQNMENTTQAMDTMKSLAQLLLKDADLTQKDATLLQNFVNGQSSQLSEKDARQLQTMIRLCQANVPAAVQQAAVQQEIPDLPRLWAFMQLCDMSVAKKMNARQLKRAGKDVATFVTSMRNAMGGENSNVQGQRSLNFMLPMYMGEESTYPSYIHVYDEKQQDPETGEMKKETWLRICVLTDNIGAVELTCRVYNDSQLDMRLFFSDTDTANEFREQADSLKDSLKDSTLKLNDLKIGAAGERRFI